MSSPLIVALDFESGKEAIDVVHRLGATADHYKVGLQLLTEAGPDLIRRLREMGKQVFLDLKLHEIPNSVAGGVKAAGKLGASIVTVHASGGSAVLRSAVSAATAFPSLKVVALTVITSLSDRDLPEIGLAPSVQAQVERLALLSASCGCHGVVASVQEAAFLKRLLPAGSLIVSAGIQLPNWLVNNQARVATPQAAAKSGATHIIVGRAITAAADPLAAFEAARASFRQDA